jgi:hypothetical protein
LVLVGNQLLHVVVVVVVVVVVLVPCVHHLTG